MIRDRIVTGLRDSRLSQLDPQLTLESVKVCYAYKNAHEITESQYEEELFPGVVIVKPVNAGKWRNK